MLTAFGAFARCLSGAVVGVLLLPLRHLGGQKSNRFRRKLVVLLVGKSKKVTDAVAMRSATKIKAVCPYSVIAIMPPKYNELYSQIKNLNKLLAWGHARAIENVLEQRDCALVISDQFASPETVKRQLFAKGKNVELRSMVRAESDVAVAAASILARAEFLWRLRELGNSFSMELPKGAGPPVLEAGKRFVAKHGVEQLGAVAKLHFKTTAALV